MLVLALQFSKGSERDRTHDDYLTIHHCWEKPLAESDRAGHSVGSGSIELRAVAEVEDPKMGRLPQNGREDKVRRAGVPRG